MLKLSMAQTTILRHIAGKDIGMKKVNITIDIDGIQVEIYPTEMTTLGGLLPMCIETSVSASISNVTGMIAVPHIRMRVDIEQLGNRAYRIIRARHSRCMMSGKRVHGSLALDHALVELLRRTWHERMSGKKKIELVSTVVPFRWT